MTEYLRGILALLCVSVALLPNLSRAIHLRDSDRRRFRSVQALCAAGVRKACGISSPVRCANGDQREGYYTFASVPVGTY